MDFLIFKSFISIEVLIGFYYLGAVLMPFVAWYLVAWLTNKYDAAKLAYKIGKNVLWNQLSFSQKLRLVFLFGVTFLFMQLFWRMLFEFLIAYMQIRDALIQP